MVVVPASLRNQVIAEFLRFLRHGEFAVLPLTGMLRARREYWSTLDKKCPNPAGRRIIVTSSNVSYFVELYLFVDMDAKILFRVQPIQSDFNQVMRVSESGPIHSPQQTEAFESEGRQTIYGQKFTLVAMDEAHDCRKTNRTFHALCGLRDCSDTFIAMTATPLISGLEVSGCCFLWVVLPTLCRICGTLGD